jgi:hypothetical protein
VVLLLLYAVVAWSSKEAEDRGGGISGCSVAGSSQLISKSVTTAKSLRLVIQAFF